MKELRTRDLVKRYAKGEFDELFKCNSSSRKSMWKNYNLVNEGYEWRIILNPQDAWDASSFERELRNVTDLLEAVRQNKLYIVLETGPVVFSTWDVFRMARTTAKEVREFLISKGLIDSPF